MANKLLVAVMDLGNQENLKPGTKKAIILTHLVD